MNQDKINPTREKILIVDDIPENLNILRQSLEVVGYDLLFATSGEVALNIAVRAAPDLILLDIIMPGIDGFETCRRLKADKTTADIPVIFITAAKDETEEVVEGFRVGGVDYIIKPFEKEEILARVETHLTNARLTKVLRQRNTELTEALEKLQQEVDRREQAEAARNQAEADLKTADERLSLISEQEAQRWGIAGFVGQSKTIGKILTEIRQLQTTGTTSVLIQGESGTGKELIARAIHFGGPRAKGPFIPVNCSAIPSELSESLFFGHVKGAFTGANKDKKGYFELADGGTLFLDEIGDMPLGLQAKLLRVIEDRCVTPIGGTSQKHVNVRILAATNADLQTRMAKGAFRSDLYYRLAGFTVDVPPLRNRPEDIPLLASHFLNLFATEMGREKPALTQDVLDALMAYPFPGNVRELKNIIERALIESGCEARSNQKIQPKHLHFVHRLDDTSSPAVMDKKMAAAGQLPLNLEEAEALLIQRALAQTDGNISEAARLLGINRSRIYRKIAKENIASNVK